MPLKSRKLIYDLLDLPTGNLTVTAIRLTRWGSEVTVTCLHRYPPEETAFRLIFKDCRGIEWNVVKPNITDNEPAHMLSHDLGEGNHQRTARIATVLVEIILSYGELVIEKESM